jgi:prevent-host-death family protein
MGRVMYGHERIGVSRNGKLAAVIVSVEDAAELEEYEMKRDVAAYRAAKARDDGTRISLEELRRSLDQP